MNNKMNINRNCKLKSEYKMKQDKSIETDVL